MAYQNVGKPRIFIDYYQYAQAIGIADFRYISGGDDTPLYETNPERFAGNKPEMFMNPLKPATCTKFTGGQTMWYYFDITQPMWGMNFYAMLGHNMGSVTMLPTVNHYDGDFPTYQNGQVYYYQGQGVEEIVNIQPNTYSTSYITPAFNGFSIWKHTEFTKDEFGTGHTLHYTKWGGTDGYGGLAAGDYSHLGTNGTYVGAFTPVCGRIYEFEHAPDLKLTMERQSDGVKSVKSIGGSDISNAIYTGPPAWPYSGNPWNITMPGTGSNILQKSLNYAGGRMGRRVWNLKFSMLSDRGDSGSLFSISENPTPLGVDQNAEGYTEGTDYTASYTDGTTTYPAEFNKDFWSDDSFMGLVYQKTLGFQLPFLWQADSSNNSADQFCMAKIDAKSLKITATSFKKYDVQLKIREVW